MVADYFIASVLADPTDDTLRLIYADWLEDQGDRRADYLRLECELRKLAPTDRGYDAALRRLQELGQTLDAEWVALVDRLPKQCSIPVYGHLNSKPANDRSAEWQDTIETPADVVLDSLKVYEFYFLGRSDVVDEDVQQLCAALDGWLRESFRQNKPYDKFVYELLTAQGSTFKNGAAVVFRDRREPDEITTMASQLFLGVRLECAKCHHHPFEVWSQDDFYSFAAYFAKIGRKGTGLSPPISGSEEVIFAAAKGEVRHPVTGKVLSPRPLFGKAPDVGDGDPRRALAEWVVSPDNPYFAKVIVNRIWADLMGRGLVDPIDDLRATNPPSNGPLLDALALQFRKDGCDLKKLLRTIMTSYVYGLSSLPGERNSGDLRYYSRHYRQRLRAEVLLDALTDITGVAETFAAMPPGSRAMQLWTVRSQSVFLDSFGRQDPNQDPPCERSSDTTVVQALHLMNAPGLHKKVTSDTGRAAKLAASKLTPAEIVEEVYLLVYCRMPANEERAVGMRAFERAASRREGAEDLLWALVNTPEFVFKD